MRIRQLGYLLCGLLLIGPSATRASFIVDPDPGGEKFFIDKPDDPTTTFSGHVGGNNVGPIVNVTTDVNVTTGNGYANIKPDKDLVLTSLTFTPVNSLLFGDFSFRGQLNSAGDVTVTVQDAQGNSPQSFIFPISNANQDFSRIGIVSLDGETIQSVTISSASFKEVKQIDFSTADPVPEPSSLALMGLGVLGILAYARRRRMASSP